MKRRFSNKHIQTWLKEGAVVLPKFFTQNEVSSVASEFEVIFPNKKGESQPLVNRKTGELPKTAIDQFKNFENIPFKCSPFLNLLCVHPALMDLARTALQTKNIRLYQSQAWAKYTGEADFEQPFHCDFGNHTLTVPSKNETLNSITFLIYFSDVSEALGPTHYVNRTDSKEFYGLEKFLKNRNDLSLQTNLKRFEKSAKGMAGTVFAYGIDVFHRGTNLTEAGGHRYAITSCFKKAGNDAIGYTAWPYHHTKPWNIIFENATPDQLSCFGVPVPGDKFWTKETLSATQLRYPKWDMQEYKAFVI